MLDWLVIGGGLHGTHLALSLAGRGGVPREGLAILDPEPEPMARWRRRTANAGVDALRSPVVHHVGVEPFGLLAFQRSNRAPAGAYTIGRYDRPSLDLFDAHARWEYERAGLAECALRGSAHAIERVRGGWSVAYGGGQVEARRVILALGQATRGAWPDWARSLLRAGVPVAHVLDDGFDRGSFLTSVRRGAAPPRIAVLGGGMSGAQLALALAREGADAVVVTRTGVRESEFDTDPCWQGPKCLDGFRRLTDLAARRRAIDGARARGTLPAELVRRVRIATGRRRLSWRATGVVSAAPHASGGIQLEFAAGRLEHFDGLVLATGLERTRPGGAWLSRAIEALELPLAPCGFPEVGADLAWAPGLHVSGSLAELEIGPVAANISGARMVGERLLDSARHASRPIAVPVSARSA